MKEARSAVEEQLGGRLEEHFAAFGPPVAAASIAQVHKAVAIDNGMRRDVAVKILRPASRSASARDLDAFVFAARQIERWLPPTRRLRPMAVVDTLARSVEIEMDLRLEAAAISEMADNIAGDQALPDGRLRVPGIHLAPHFQRVLTLEWIDGVPNLGSRRACCRRPRPEGAGPHRPALVPAPRHARRLLPRRHAPGQPAGRQGGHHRRRRLRHHGPARPHGAPFLAEILHGLITRDYRRAALIHFEAGYVPPYHSVEVFAQAMRAIGEPIHGRTAAEISMADLLGQLFAYTDVFDMQTRPELLLLQKTMVVVEGVARSLDPELNIWSAAEPIAKEWIEANYGVSGGRLREAGEGAEVLGRVMAEVPRLLAQAERTALALADMARGGFKLDDDTVERLAAALADHNRWTRLALWVGALALAAMAVWLMMPVG